MTGTRLLVIAAALGMAAACTAEPAGMQDGPRRLAADFIEEFHVGDDPSEHQFAELSEVVFAPDGRLVVLDAKDFTVTAYDTEGNPVGSGWGSRGEGPGEFPAEPGSMAVSDDGILAIASLTRLDLFTLDGTVVNSRLIRPLRVREIAFFAGDSMVATVNRGPIMGDVPTELMRLTDAEVLWTSPPIPSIFGDMPFAIWQPAAVFLPLRDGRVAIGISDAYDLQVLDVATSRTVGRISRDVPLRGPTDEFMETQRQELIAIGGEDSPLVQRLSPLHPFPVLTRALTGPPGHTIWIGRGTGIGDALASPVGNSMSDWTHRHYDLFDGDSYEYTGTVVLPENFILMAADSERIAGLSRGPFGIPSVRVLRVEID